MMRKRQFIARPYYSSRNRNNVIENTNTKHKGKAGLQMGLMTHQARELDQPPTPEVCAGPDGPT